MSIDTAPSAESGAAAGADSGSEPSQPAAQAPRSRPEARWARYLEAELGLREYWYPVFFGVELKEGETRAEYVGGEPIIFKRVEGEVYAVRDRCLHRGVPFSARPECYTPNTLTCWFHGFTFDVRDGKLVQILSEPGSKLIGKVSLKSYPVREEFQTVFVWIGDGEPVPFEEEIPVAMAQSLTGEQRIAFHPIARIRIPCNWRLAMENGFDPGHIYGHRNSEFAKRGWYVAPLGVYPESHDFVGFEREPGRPKAMSLDYSQWTTVWDAEIDGVNVTARRPDPEGGKARRFPEILEDDGGSGMAYLPCLYAAPSFPAAHMTHYEWYVPSDAEHHLYIILHSKVVNSDEEEKQFHDECDEHWSQLIWSADPAIEGFNNFDGFGREQVQNGYQNEGMWHQERLYRPDYPLTQWRAFVSEEAREIQRAATGFAPSGEASETLFIDEPGTTG